jgi:ADP-ribosylation factor GTPase-activating protein 1
VGKAWHAEGIYTSPIPLKHPQLTTTIQLAEADLAAQARNTAATLGQGIQSGATAAGGAINRLVDPDAPVAHKYDAVPREKQDFWDSFGEPAKGPSRDKQDFWDEFGAAPQEKGSLLGGSASSGAGGSKKPSGIGTSAVKKGRKEDDSWGDW